jgi:hypothetical protein
MDAVGVAKAKAGNQAKTAQPETPSSANDQGLLQEPTPRRVFYGLPCASCGTYYASDLSTCPICKSAERVLPTSISAPPLPATPDLASEDNELERERELFLKEFKAQLFAAHSQINTATNFRCTLEKNHHENSEPAAICKSCYAKLQEEAGRLEAALHIDLKEAAQIVYEAVWADSSDPSKTYANAAQALLTELRKRAGVNTVMSTLQPYAN